MNDFTKEELKFIYEWLEWVTKENYPLKNKIQSMIDNYCEQDIVGLTHARWYTCKKCFCQFTLTRENGQILKCEEVGCEF